MTILSNTSMNTATKLSNQNMRSYSSIATVTSSVTVTSSSSTTATSNCTGSLFRLSTPNLAGNNKIMPHPKYKVGFHNWYIPPRGASMMKHHYTLPYKRLNKRSLYHYPEVSAVTGKAINWMWDEPKSGYEFRDIYGHNTIELTNLPMSATPEKMQERLRRWFSKFGHIEHCRAIPHSHDPYQCEGTAYITLNTKRAVWDAIHSPLKLCISHHEKVIQMRSLDNDKRSDPILIKKREFWDGELVRIAERLHDKLLRENKPIALKNIATDLFVTETDRQGRRNIADQAVYQRFVSWQKFLTFREFADMFLVFQHENTDKLEQECKLRHKFDEISGAEISGNILEEGEWYVSAQFISLQQRKPLMVKARNSLFAKFDAELSPHWRKGKITLPEHVEKLNKLWLRKPKLPERLQLMSRPGNVTGNCIFGEKLMFRLKLRRERNKRRQLNRAPKVAERKEAIRQLEEAKDAEERAWENIERSRRMKQIGRNPNSILNNNGAGHSTGLLMSTAEGYGEIVLSQIQGTHVNDNDTNSKIKLPVGTKSLSDLRLLSMLKNDPRDVGEKPSHLYDRGIFERAEMAKG